MKHQDSVLLQKPASHREMFVDESCLDELHDTEFRRRIIKFIKEFKEFKKDTK